MEGLRGVDGGDGGVVCVNGMEVVLEAESKEGADGKGEGVAFTP
jgi:hypothetical protein